MRSEATMDSAKSELLQQKEEEMASLRARIEQLNEELKTATAEKIQSAQYGLVLLVELFCLFLYIRCCQFENVNP